MGRVNEAHVVGTWGVGLYQCDDTSDLRDDFREVVRAPWDGGRLLEWALETYPEAGDARADGYADLRLALADLFWLYGIEQHDVQEEALALVDDGGDLESKQALGMSDRDLKRRAVVLDGLAAKWRSTNPKPRGRQMLKAPQPFLLEPGDCLVYPTCEGRVRNPYVSTAKEEWYYKIQPWERDGWAAAIVLGRAHRFETFARYVIAILRSDGDVEPAIDVFPSLSILHSRTFGHEPMRRVHVVSTTRMHLRRMGVDIVGNLPVSESKVDAAFAEELKRNGRVFANDAWTLPHTYSYKPERLAPADVLDPVAAFLE
jgi:hypothetical protein